MKWLFILDYWLGKESSYTLAVFVFGEAMKHAQSESTYETSHEPPEMILHYVFIFVFLCLQNVQADGKNTL